LNVVLIAKECDEEWIGGNILHFGVESCGSQSTSTYYL